MKEKDGASGVGELKAGRELDALVAEKLGLPLEPPCARYHSVDDAEYDSNYGWSGWCYSCEELISEVAPQPLRYSTDIAAAWEVVEKMRLDGWRFEFSNQDGALAAFWQRYARSDREIVTAKTAPLAICLCALMAVESVVPVESSSFGEPK